MSARLHRQAIIFCLVFACTLSACRPHSNTNMNTTSEAVHQQAMNHMAMGISLKNRGVGAGPNVPRATQSDLEQAVSEFRETLRLEPDNHAASFGLAETLIKLNKTDEGVAILHTLTKNNDNYATFAQTRLTKMGVSSTK